MPAPTIDRPDKGTESTGAIGVSSRPVSGSKDLETPIIHGYEPWKVITAFVVVLIIAAAAIFGVVRYMDGQAAEKLRQEQISNALRDLNNRVVTEDINGSFSEVFFVGNQMRARWESDNGLKRCVMVVSSPTDSVLRYSTLDVPNDDAGFRQLNDPNAVGCLTSGGAGGVGGS